jgi:membrane carboxypeptidase/penicillin-binding protein PbpC
MKTKNMNHNNSYIVLKLKMIENLKNNNFRERLMITLNNNLQNNLVKIINNYNNYNKSKKIKVMINIKTLIMICHCHF